MSRKGDCWDNAPMESVNGTLKVECVNDVHFETREQARREIVEYIGYYNTERRHEWHRVTHRRPVPVRRKRPNQPSVDNALRASWRPRYGVRFSLIPFS